MFGSNRRMRRRRSRRRRLIFTIVSVCGFFGSIEALLWLFEIEQPNRVEAMAFSFPIDEYNQSSPQPFLERDPELFWKPRAGVLGHNSRGCLGPDFSDKPAEAVFRILCLGDSCTHFGPVPYPEMLQEKLNETAPGRFEVINAAVIGYTSFQGMKLLESKGINWSPHLVTVYFAWNDHWLARHFADKDQPRSLSLMTQTSNLLDHSRTFQLIRMFANAAREPERPGLRVELEDFAATFSEFRLCVTNEASRSAF